MGTSFSPSIIVAFLYFLFFIVLVIVGVRSLKNYFIFRKFPQEPSNLIFGDIFKFVPVNPFTLDFHKKINDNIRDYLYRHFFNNKKWEPITVGWIGWVPIVALVKHEGIVGIDNKLLIEKTSSGKVLQLKNGLLASEPKLWKMRRKMIEPFFKTKFLQSYIRVIDEVFLKTIQELEYKSTSSVNLIKLIQRSSLNIILNLSTKLPLNEEKKEKTTILDTVHFITKNEFTLLCNPIYRFDPFFCYSSFEKKLRKLVSQTESFLTRLIESRCAKSSNIQNTSSMQDDQVDRKDLLDLLHPHIDAGLIDSQGINEELFSMISAGYETVSISLTWILFCLGNHEKIQQKLYEEIVSHFPNSKPIKEYHEINQLVYLDQCLKEGLRLYPPIPFFSRQLPEDCPVDCCHIPRGTCIIVAVLVIQRDPTVYSNPELYDPERFSPENVSSIPKHAFIPFGVRPRDCIGYRLAYLEMKIFLIHLLKKYHVSSKKKMEEISFKSEVTLRPTSTLEFKLTPRSSMIS